MRAIDAVIDKTLADRPDAAARLRQEAGLKLDAMLKAGDTIEPPKTRAPPDRPAPAPDAVAARRGAARTKTLKRPSCDPDR